MAAGRVELIVNQAWHTAVLQRADGKHFPKSPEEYLHGPRQQTPEEIFAVLEGMSGQTFTPAKARTL